MSDIADLENVPADANALSVYKSSTTIAMGFADHNRKRFEILDGMRGFAALAVMFFHYFINADTRVAGRFMFINATGAVDLFFVLSGFVIAHSYSLKLDHGMTNINYLYRRVVRLYPLYFLSLLTGSILAFISSVPRFGLTPGNTITAFSYNVIFLPFFNEANQIFPANLVLWSIFFEVIASVAFPFLTKKSTKFLCTISGTALLSIIAYGHFFSNNTFSAGNNGQTFIGGFPRVFFSFCLGMVIMRLVTRLKNKEYKIVAEGPFSRSLIIYGVMMMLLVFPFQLGGFYFLLQITALPFLVFYAAICATRSRLDMLTSRFLGWISYPLYCFHMPVFFAVQMLTGAQVVTDAQDSHWSLILISSCLTLLISIVVTKIYDEPVRSILGRAPFNKWFR